MCQVNSWCSCVVDAQHASDWLCELGADVGSVTGLCQQCVLIRTDYSQLVSEEFFSAFLFSCFEPFLIRLRACILKGCAQLFSWCCFIFCIIHVLRLFWNVVLHMVENLSNSAFPSLTSPEEKSAFLPVWQEHGEMQSLLNVALPPETQ